METSTRTIDQRLALDARSLALHGGEHWTVHLDGTTASDDSFAHSIARGLSDHPRWLHCRYLYDEEGSRIFSKITQQPEYYLTGAESEILAARADEIRELAGAVPIVELGAGSAAKTRHLLDAWRRAAGENEVHYLPIDIDPSVLTRAARQLAEDYDRLRVTGIATSYERGLDAVTGLSPMCLVFLGSTIGNFNPEETDAFLARLERALAPDDSLLLGLDLAKDIDTLEAAYDDAAGWSRRFTRNLFARMNRELGTEVDVAAIDHVAFWNDRLKRIEIYARFQRAMHIELRSIARSFRVAAGEMVLTEISRKYRIRGISADLARFGFALERTFTDEAGRFALLLCRRIRSSPGPDLASRLVGELQTARLETLDLVEALSDEQLEGQVTSILSPIAWDLGHMAEFEEMWLVKTVDALRGKAEPGGELETIYDAARTPRSERGALELPDRVELLRRLRQIRRAALERLRVADLDAGQPLLANGFVYRMLSQHETQHQETILQAVALMNDAPFEPAHRLSAPRAKLPPDTRMVIVPPGRFQAGTASAHGAYDNERPVHWVELHAFWIDTAPVTVGDWLTFMEAGGYERRDHWSEEGRTWLSEERCGHPSGWQHSEDGWVDVQFGHVEPLVLTRPVQHVSWYEADAYARWAGKRLPTELEWEKAAAWDPELRISRVWPWGDAPPAADLANLGARTYAPAPVGAYPRGRSFYGCHQMIGDVWEWTSSEFLPYPGFEAFPYPEYSEVHFGKGHRVLRGGSWATAPIVARNTFRNWDLPERRQIFAGLRCARDA
ncbi:MAG TPA: ergothioneine biosynthesis protein EgtB [Gemmatimonadota bacterium]|nr:ergothioneine biosynthesis protein EgtB [Gemmatimonadota bacterium]